MEDDGGAHRPDDGTSMPCLPGEIVSPAAGEFELVCDIWSSDAHMAREHARQAAAIAEPARRRSVGRDAGYGPRGGPGRDARAVHPAALADVSDDFVSELALIRTCSEAEAGRLAVDVSEAVAAEVQARVLPGAQDCPPSRLGDRARYHLYRLDAEAKERRRREAERRADVHVERTADDLGRLVVEGPLPAVHAARDAVDQYARWMRADGDDRPIGLLRATAALDLILRPWDTSRPSVTAHLVVHAAAASVRPDAPSGAPPAEVDGQLITAARCRELLASLDRLGAAPAGGSVCIAVDAPGTGETVAVATRAELRRGAGRGRRVRRGDSPDPPGEPAGPGLRPPPPTGAYRPTAAQERLVRVRDRHCRMPGCRGRPGRCDLDHGQAYAEGGPTACWNLCCLCRRHHRIKTFARGWSFALHRDGRLVVRTPSGVSRTTRPPGWFHDPVPDPPWLDEVAPLDPLGA